MNYFAHALPFLDRPYFAAGTAVPDMLSVVDRKIRLRSKHVVPFQEDADSVQRDVARGVLQHFQDDDAFHETRAFAEVSLELTVLFRDTLDGESGMRVGFLGHLLTEILLDATLIEEHPDELAAYYALLSDIDATAVEAAVNRMAPRQTDRLALMLGAIPRERFLSDYADDDRLMLRLGQIMRRVGLPPLPEVFVEALPSARKRVADRRDALLPR